MMRLETTLTDESEIRQVEWLRGILGEGNSGLLRDALTLLGWAVEEVASGRRVASIDATGESVREFTMPALARARRRSTRTVETEGMVRIAELLASPPEPTEELRRLMRKHEQHEEAAVGR